MKRFDYDGLRGVGPGTMMVMGSAISVELPLLVDDVTPLPLDIDVWSTECLPPMRQKMHLMPSV